MQIKIKSVTQNDHEYQGNITKRKLIETSEGSYNVSEKNKSYEYIPLGFSGVADIEFSDYKGKRYIKIFKAGKGKTTQTAQKSQETQNKAVSGAFKKDPAGIALEIWKRRHTSWIGCLQCAKQFYGETETSVNNIISVTNQFYDALCKKVDKQKEDVDRKSNDINNDIHSNTGPQPASDIKETDIDSVPF